MNRVNYLKLFSLVAFVALGIVSCWATSSQGEDVVITVNGVSFKMIKVEGGTFTMGATPEQGDDAFDIEKPTHRVTLSDYYIGETEVTQALWKAVMGESLSQLISRNGGGVHMV